MKFQNPYLDVEDRTVLTTKVATADSNLVKCTRPGLSTITGTVGLLFQKLCYELRQRNITDVSKRDEFEDFVANCRIVDGRLSDGAFSGPVHQTTSPYDPGRTEATSNPSKEYAPELPRIQSGGGKGGRAKDAAKGQG